MGRQREEGVACPTASRNWEVPCAAKGGQRGLNVSAGAGPPDTRGPDATRRAPGPRSQPATPWAPLHSCSHMSLDPLLPTFDPMALSLPGPDAESLRTLMCRNIRREPSKKKKKNRALRGGLVARGLAPAFPQALIPEARNRVPPGLSAPGLLLPLCGCLSRSLTLCVS